MPDRPNRRRNAVWRIASAVTALALLSAPQATADEAAARELLKAMTDYLAAQPTLSFDIDSSVDVVTTDGQKLLIASSASVAVQRPDRIRVARHGGFATVDLVFDGKTLSVLNREANSYAQAEHPGTIDALVTTLRDTYQRPLPAADFLAADVGELLLAEVTDVKDLGSGVIRGMECDHLAFRTADVDWQIWIAQGEVPHPCRFVVTTRTVDGWPEYRLDFSNWGSGAVAADFTFAPPEGAAQVEISAVPDLDEVAGIFMIDGAN